MPEDIGFFGMRNTKQTVVGGGNVGVGVLGGTTTARLTWLKSELGGAVKKRQLIKR